MLSSSIVSSYAQRYDYSPASRLRGWCYVPEEPSSRRSICIMLVPAQLIALHQPSTQALMSCKEVELTAS